MQLPVYLLPSLLDPSDKHAFMHKYVLYILWSEDETTYVYNQIRIGQNMRTVTYILLIVRK